MPELIHRDEDLIKMRKFRRDLEWFKANYEEIKNQYNGQFVVINNEEILDTDKDVRKLFERLQEKKIDLSSLVIEYINPYKAAYVL